MENCVKSLIEKAEKAQTSGEALHYSQAALNAANAMCSLQVVGVNLAARKGSVYSEVADQLTSIQEDRSLELSETDREALAAAKQLVLEAAEQQN